MNGEVLKLSELSNSEIDALDRTGSIFVMAVSPLEVHGPHDPPGTDVIVSEEVMGRSIAEIRERRPGITFILFPPFYWGSDTIPGSMDVKSRALNLVLKASADFLADRGFHYLLVIDNHGGPRHRIAITKAVRTLHEGRGFHIIAPFLRFYHRMIENDEELLARLQIGRGACGDADDVHAGLNETSLMLAIDESRVRAEWNHLTRVTINRRRWPSLLLDLFAKGLRHLGAKEAAQDILHIGLMLSWATEKNPSTHVGEPCGASRAAGDKMLDAHAEEAADAVDAAIPQTVVMDHSLLATKQVEGQAEHKAPLGSWKLQREPGPG